MVRARKALRAGLVVLLCGVGPSVVHAWANRKGFRASRGARAKPPRRDTWRFAV